MSEDNQYFFVLPDDVNENEGTLILRDEEAHHCLQVLRKKSGDVFYAVNGRGWEYQIRLKEKHHQRVVCDIIQKKQPERELPWTIILGVALIKPDRFEWILEKAVELGVSRIVPLKTERSLPEPGPARLQRWQKIIYSAMKQCRRAHLPVLLSPVQFDSWIATTAEHKLIFHESAERPLADYTGSHLLNSGETVMLLIGPEGGFTQKEIFSARQHAWNVLSLGPRRLRSETAALAAIAFFALSVSCKEP